jgi:hypothetical protein
MSLVRYAGLLALAIWLGGMIVLGAIVAPSIFGVLQLHNGTAGRVLAGATFGEILGKFYVLSYICGAIMLAALTILKFAGASPRLFVVRATFIGIMLACALYAGVPVQHEINGIQLGVSGAISNLPETDPRRVRFDFLHTLSTRLMTADIAIGLVLLGWYVRD